MQKKEKDAKRAESVRYYNDRVSSCISKHFRSNNGRHRIIKESLSRIVDVGMSVLDVGCGIGVTSRHMASLGASVIAVDQSDKLIEFATKSSVGENIIYFAEDICDFKLEVRFDVVVFSDVIEHIIPEYAHDAITNIIKNNTHENTVIYVNIPDKNFLDFVRDNKPELLQIIDNGYSISEIVGMFGEGGFVPTKINLYGLDTRVQYNEYVFCKKSWLVDHYKKILTGENDE